MWPRWLPWLGRPLPPTCTPTGEMSTCGSPGRAGQESLCPDHSRRWPRAASGHGGPAPGRCVHFLQTSSTHVCTWDWRHMLIKGRNTAEVSVSRHTHTLAYVHTLNHTCTHSHPHSHIHTEVPLRCLCAHTRAHPGPAAHVPRLVCTRFTFRFNSSPLWTNRREHCTYMGLCVWKPSTHV